MPIGPLMVEHRWIERVVGDLDVRLSGKSGFKKIDAHYVETVVDFLRTYADRCHHGKEEDILFKALAGKPLEPDLAGMMRRLVAEHEWARTTTRSLMAANAALLRGNANSEAEVRRLLKELASFYPRHIETEDDHFFRPIMTYFSQEEQQAMLSSFTTFDATLVHEKYRGIVEELEEA